MPEASVVAWRLCNAASCRKNHRDMPWSFSSQLVSRNNSIVTPSSQFSKIQYYISVQTSRSRKSWNPSFPTVVSGTIPHFVQCRDGFRRSKFLRITMRIRRAMEPAKVAFNTCRIISSINYWLRFPDFMRTKEAPISRFCFVFGTRDQLQEEQEVGSPNSNAPNYQ